MLTTRPSAATAAGSRGPGPRRPRRPSQVGPERHDDADRAGAQRHPEVVEQLQRRVAAPYPWGGAERSVSWAWAA